MFSGVATSRDSRGGCAFSQNQKLFITGGATPQLTQAMYPVYFAIPCGLFTFLFAEYLLRYRSPFLLCIGLSLTILIKIGCLCPCRTCSVPPPRRTPPQALVATTRLTSRLVSIMLERFSAYLGVFKSVTLLTVSSGIGGESF